MGSLSRRSIRRASQREIHGSPVAVGTGTTRAGAVSASSSGSRSQADNLDARSQASMKNLVRFVLLAELFAVATYALGWWTVPIVAVLWAIVSRDSNSALVASLCAAGGWTSLLLLDAARGPVGTMASRLGGVMGVPGFVLLILTIVFPALLAWCAASLASGLLRLRPKPELPA
jgi:hypothetical protein